MPNTMMAIRRNEPAKEGKTGDLLTKDFWIG
jgi:hypothetical protein